MNGEEIFRAVAQSAVASLLEALESKSEGTDTPFAELAPTRGGVYRRPLRGYAVVDRCPPGKP
jgi:hypothetical protein